MSDFYDPGTGTHVIVDGMIVERDALRIAEAIRDYDSNLVVLCVDPNHVEGISEEPFVIAERGPDGVLRPILRAWTLDDTILQRIHLADNQKFNTFNTLLNLEEQQKKRYRYEWEQFRGDAKDKIAHIAGMRSKYTVPDEKTGDTITFYDDRPARENEENLYPYSSLNDCYICFCIYKSRSSSYRVWRWSVSNYNYDFASVSGGTMRDEPEHTTDKHHDDTCFKHNNFRGDDDNFDISAGVIFHNYNDNTDYILVRRDDYDKLATAIDDFDIHHNYLYVIDAARNLIKHD